MTPIEEERKKFCAEFCTRHPIFESNHLWSKTPASRQTTLKKKERRTIIVAGQFSIEHKNQDGTTKNKPIKDSDILCDGSAGSKNTSGNETKRLSFIVYCCI
jgi:hypothetical protein